MIRPIVLLLALLVSTVSFSQQTYVVGTWNLEHFHDGTRRGFPETPNAIPTRSDDDYEFIAGTIIDLDVRILILQEIFGEWMEIEDEDGVLFDDVRSLELDKLVGFVGDSYEYVMGESGGSQHVAFLYDTEFVQLNAACETDFPRIVVQNKNVFDRQPLYGHFTFLDGNQERNDLVVVGVHLASGQNNNRNHDKAMDLLLDELEAARDEEFCIPSDEFDVLIGGDFNANRFGGPVEDFWNEMESDGWDFLGDDGASYPATRLSGNPLALRTSQIDYLVVSQRRSRRQSGLAGEEVLAAEPTFHTSLASDPDEFRRQASDHLPVTVEILVMDDTD